MENNELAKIKDKKEKFYMLRKEIVGNSCKEVSKQVLEYRNFLEKYPDYKRYDLKNPSIRKRVLDDLEWDGFFLKDKGTQYLASLITIFFHERKLYRRGDICDKSYWDLSDFSNEHYGMLGNSKSNVIREILKAIRNSEIENGPIEEVVYTIADSIGYYGRDRDDRKRVPYVKLLKK